MYTCTHSYVPAPESPGPGKTHKHYPLYWITKGMGDIRGGSREGALVAQAPSLQSNDIHNIVLQAY